MIRRLAILVWISWLSVLGLMIAYVAAAVPHPHYLPMALAFGTFLVAGLAVVVAATWRLARGPHRGRALRWVWLGLAPIGFMTGQIGYGLRVAQGRQLERRAALRLLIPFGEAMLDLTARFAYPQRTEGAHVVMISGRVADARAQVVAMDRHIERIAARLGRRPSGKAYWVRGPLFGMDGKAIYGLCLGSRPGEHEVEEDGLTTLDRHEVAHCVITMLTRNQGDPPSVLCEGWAEANSGLDPTQNLARARDHRRHGDELSLRELTGPAWYNRHQWPAYVQGAALVDLILRRFGPDAFLDLYAHCRSSTFDADCRRTLGVGRDDLDASYRSEVAGPPEDDSSPAWRWLEGRPHGPDVVESDWRAFLAKYRVASRRLLAPYRQVRQETLLRHRSVDAAGKQKDAVERTWYARDGDLRSWRRAVADHEEAYLVRPGRSFQASRERGKGPWEIATVRGQAPSVADGKIARMIESREHISNSAVRLTAIADDFLNYGNSSRIRLTRFEPIVEDGHPCLLIRLENPNKAGVGTLRAISMVLAADDSFIPRSDRIETDDEAPLLGVYHYDRRDGLPIFRSVLRTRPSGTANGSTTEIRVVDRRFGPVPASEFTREAVLGGGPWVERVVDPDDAYKAPPSFADWYGVPLIGGAVALLLGLVPRRPPRDEAAEIEGD